MRLKSILILLMILLLQLTGAQAQSSSYIQKVDVVLKVQGVAPPVKVEQRMTDSIRKVGEALLLDKPDEPDPELADLYSRTIRQVFDRVLLGYSVESAEVELGSVSRISVVLRPWGEVVQQVKVQWDYGDVHAATLPLLQADAAGLDTLISESILGLPVDAVDWAGAMNKVFWTDKFELQLPEYRPHIEITPGATTVVRVNLQPLGSTVQEIHVTLRSHNLPSLALADLEKPLREQARQLYHLPVAFVQRHQAELTDLFQRTASVQPLTKRYGLTYQASLEPGAQTLLTLDGETEKYRMFIEGYLDFGREKDSTSVKIHLGQKVAPKDELFFEGTFVPSRVAWDLATGYSRTLHTKIEVGLRRNWSNSSNTAFLHYQMSPAYSLRLEQTNAGGKELALRYRLHEFLSAEYIIQDKENWLRLVGSL